MYIAAEEMIVTLPPPAIAVIHWCSGGKHHRNNQVSRFPQCSARDPTDKLTWCWSLLMHPDTLSKTSCIPSVFQLPVLKTIQTPPCFTCSSWTGSLVASLQAAIYAEDRSISRWPHHHRESSWPATIIPFMLINTLTVSDSDRSRCHSRRAQSSACHW